MPHFQAHFINYRVIVVDNDFQQAYARATHYQKQALTCHTSRDNVPKMAKHPRQGRVQIRADIPASVHRELVLLMAGRNMSLSEATAEAISLWTDSKSMSGKYLAKQVVDGLCAASGEEHRAWFELIVLRTLTAITVHRVGGGLGT